MKRRDRRRRRIKGKMGKAGGGSGVGGREDRDKGNEKERIRKKRLDIEDGIEREGRRKKLR